MDTPEFAASKVKKIEGGSPAAGGTAAATLAKQDSRTIKSDAPAISVPSVFLDAFAKPDPDDIVGNPSTIHPALAEPKPGHVVTMGESYPAKLTPDEEKILTGRIADSKESREKFLAYLAGAGIDLKKELRDLFVASLKERLKKAQKPWHVRLWTAIRNAWNSLFGKDKDAIEASRLMRVISGEARRTRALRALVQSVSREFTVESVNEFTLTMSQVLEDCRQGKIETLPGETERDAARRVVVERAKAFE